MLNFRNSVARPDTETIRRGMLDGTFSGKSLAISKKDGSVVETADSVDELSQLMSFRHPDCEYRVFVAPL